MDEMTGIEKQLSEIIDSVDMREEKAELHAFIDTLKDGDSVLLMHESPEDGGYFRVFGDPTDREMLWMVEQFKQWLLSPECSHPE